MTTALWVLTSLVDDFAGWGATVIQWYRVNRGAPPHPYPDLIADYVLLEPGTRERAERAVRALLTGEEAAALGTFFTQNYPGLAMRMQPGALELPLYPDELAALVESEPDPDVTRCLVRLPATGPSAPVPILGIASPWPWPELEPADVARLIDVRARMGLDPVPPTPGHRRPRPGSAAR